MFERMNEWMNEWISPDAWALITILYIICIILCIILLCVEVSLFLSLSFFAGGTRVWTQGLLQVLSHLSHTPSPFCFIFQIGSRWAQTVILLPSPPWDFHHDWLFLRDRVWLFALAAFELPFSYLFLKQLGLQTRVNVPCLEIIFKVSLLMMVFSP
jgi:hypothetical protein